MKIIFVLLLLQYALGHNWVATESRVPFAATTFPCMNKRTSLPHIQIHPNQKWQTEWAIGHESFNYFTLIKSEDSHELVRHNRNNLEAYLSGGVNQLPSNNRYKKLRRTPDNSAPSQLTLIGPGHPQFLDRPDEFGRTNEGGFDGEGYLWDYPYNQEDAFVSYRSTAYPWIMAIWKYEIEFGDASQIDTAEFWLADPSGELALGDYILHYSWRGYYDCIDINVIDIGSFVPFPYGAPPPPGNSSYVARRVDHCIFKGVEAMTGTPRKVYGPYGEQSCVDWCISRYGFGCGGINVHKFNLGSRPFPGTGWDNTDNFILDMVNESFYVERYPFTHYELGRRYKNTYQDDYNPSTDQSRDDLKALFQNAADQEDFLACFPVWPRQISTTQDKYVISDDPEDPVFYSTCYEVVKVKIFIGFNTSTDSFVTRHDFRAFDRCLDCVVREKNSRAQVPDWEVLPVGSDQCVNCDREPPTFVPPAFPDEPLLIGGRCGENEIFGGLSGSNCVHEFSSSPYLWTEALGFGTYEGMGPEGCGALVEDNPDCGTLWWYVYWNYPSPGLCACLRTGWNSQCANCQLTGYATDGTVYTKDHANLGRGSGTGDCSNGVPDSTNTYCCTSGCTTCQSGRRYATGGMMCWPEGIPSHRTCDLYAPPCLM